MRARSVGPFALAARRKSAEHDLCSGRVPAVASRLSAAVGAISPASSTHGASQHGDPNKSSQRGPVSEAVSGCEHLRVVQHPGLRRPLREGRLPRRRSAQRAGGAAVCACAARSPSCRRPPPISQALDAFQHGMTQLEMLSRQSSISKMFPQDRHAPQLRQQCLLSEPQATTALITHPPLGRHAFSALRYAGPRLP